MKRKNNIVFILFISLILITSILLASCGNNKKPPVDDKKEEVPGGQIIPTPEEVVDTNVIPATDVITAIANQKEKNERNYDFTLKFEGGDIVVYPDELHGDTSHSLEISCYGNNRYDEAKNEHSWKIKTEGLLLPEGTKYYQKAANDLTVLSFNKVNVLQSVTLKPTYEDRMILIDDNFNPVFSFILDALTLDNITNIENSTENTNFKYKAELNIELQDENKKALDELNKTLYDLVDAFRVSNPSYNNVTLLFNINDNKELDKFSIETDLIFRVGDKYASTKMVYNQEIATNPIEIDFAGEKAKFITDESDIQHELASINSAIANLNHQDAHSIDRVVTNSFDQGWNQDAITHKYTELLLKNNSDFNCSFKYAFPETVEGSEKNKFVYGNAQDANVYLVKRLPSTPTSNKVDNVTRESLFNKSLGQIILESKDIACIQKSVGINGVTIYKIHLLDDKTKSVQEAIVSELNDNPTDPNGAYHFKIENNYVDEVRNGEVRINKAFIEIEIKDNKLSKANIATKVKYFDAGDKYSSNKDARVTINNTVEIVVNEEDSYATAMGYEIPTDGEKIKEEKFYLLN